MNIQQAQDDLVEQFEMFDDWMDKYRMLVEMGRTLDPFPPELRTEDNLVFGCQSQVWYAGKLVDGKIQLQATSDAQIVCGLIACILQIFNNRTPEEIIDADLDFIKRIGLDDNLSMSRVNGLVSMIDAVKMIAEIETL